MPGTSGLHRFVWHDLATSDPERAKPFYADLLGLGYEVFGPGEQDYTMISAGDRAHGGVVQAPAGVPSHWLGHVQVEDVDAAAARAASGGGAVRRPPDDVRGVGRFALITDPDGCELSLYAPLRDGPAAEGVFAWNELMTLDVERAKRFYGDVCGWTAGDMDMGTPDGFVYTIFQAGSEQVAGAMAKHEQVPAPGWTYYLRTDDVDAVAARTPELGGALLQEPFDVGQGIGRIAIVADPTGAVCGLFQPGPRDAEA